MPLWPQTVRAILASLTQRPLPRRKAHEGLLFITQRGNPWTDGQASHAVIRKFCSLMNKTDLRQPGRGSYGLRRTFETIGGESIDQIAVDHIMGHSGQDMASVYRQRISDERLVAVTDHVRACLFGDDEAG